MLDTILLPLEVIMIVLKLERLCGSKLNTDLLLVMPHCTK